MGCNTSHTGIPHLHSVQVSGRIAITASLLEEIEISPQNTINLPSYRIFTAVSHSLGWKARLLSTSRSILLNEIGLQKITQFFCFDGEIGQLKGWLETIQCIQGLEQRILLTSCSRISTNSLDKRSFAADSSLNRWAKGLLKS